jgi:glycosyltransferase involved in cell wall biosynthesis
LGVVLPADPAALNSWSGIPSGVCRGLAQHGVEVCPIDVRAPALLERAVTTALGVPLRSRSLATQLPAVAALRSVAARIAFRNAGRLDGVVQIGTGYSVPAGARVVTLEDMTVRQATALYPAWRRLPVRAVRRRVDRQRRAYDAAHACCTLTKWAAQSIIHEYGVPAQKVHVVGVGRNLCPPAGPRDWTSPRFLFVGHDWERKNGPGVLNAFARLRHERPDARLDVVGGHPSINAAGVTGHGVLRLDDPGDRARLETLFSTTTCFVMPSWIEPAGIVYTEAAAAGVPVIGTTEGGSGDIIGDGGRIVHPADEDALVDAMRAFADPELARRVGEIAQRRSQFFTWPSVAGRLLRALGLPPRAGEAMPEYLDAV